MSTGEAFKHSVCQSIDYTNMISSPLHRSGFTQRHTISQEEEGDQQRRGGLFNSKTVNEENGERNRVTPRRCQGGGSKDVPMPCGRPLAGHVRARVSRALGWLSSASLVWFSWILREVCARTRVERRQGVMG